jgi:general secretion pathway protein D
MKRSTLAFAFALSLVLFFAAAPRAQAQSAHRLYKQGQKAENRGDLQAAYDDYSQAYRKKPSDERYRVAYERVLFPVAAQHVQHGEQLEKLGDNSGALAEFMQALTIDPSNELASQDIAALRNKINAAANHNNSEAPRTAGEAFAQLAPPLQLKPISNEPLTLHMVEDSKVIYETVGKAAGINVLFDPDYVSKRIQVDLANTTLSQALRIISTVSNTFYRVITPNTIFVAADTRAKRMQLEDQAVQTFYLHNVTQQSDFTDIQTALRNVFQTAHIFGVASQNAIVMRATPDELLLARQLIRQLDQPKPEVLVDVAVLEVSRNFERKIGLQLPQTATVNLQASTSSSSSSSSSSGSSSSSSTTSSGLTLNNLAHLNSNNFAVTIGQAQAALLLTNTDTQIIQEPRIRASDGQDAQLKIGEKLPVATGSYQTGAATAIVSSLVNTQFQYLDVGVNIDVKPTVLSDHDVSMKVKIDVSSTNGTENLGGVDEPIITQRVADETIRLKNGEANLIGGIRQVQTSNSLSGTPGLSELPLLKYIFGVHDHTVSKDDLVILLIPHVVSAPTMNPNDLQPIDTGTSDAFQVRTVSQSQPAPQPAQKAPAAQPATQAVTQTAQPQTSAQAVAHQAMQQMTQEASSGPPALLQLMPSQTTVKPGSTFQLAVHMEGGRDVYAVPMKLKYDASRLSLVNVNLQGAGRAQMSFLGKDGQAVALVHRDDGGGHVEISASRPPGVKGVSGSGTLCVLTFKAKAPGAATVQITRPVIRNSQQQTMPAVGSLAVVQVQ